MSKVCAITGKGPLSGNKRSHSLRATRRKWNVNLQKVNVMVDGKPQKIRISARALRTLKNKEYKTGQPVFSIHGGIYDTG